MISTLRTLGGTLLTAGPLALSSCSPPYPEAPAPALDIQATAPHDPREKRKPSPTDIVRVLFLHNSRGCVPWAPSTEETLARLRAGEIPGPWNRWRIDSVDQGTWAGRLATSRYGPVDVPVVLAFDRTGKLQAAHEQVPSGVHLLLRLEDLAHGRGTRADINRRLDETPGDLSALWDLFQMQAASPLLGSPELTMKRIAALDPEFRTSQGQSVRYLQAAMAYFRNLMTAGAQDPACPLPGLDALRELIRQLESPRARRFAHVHLAEFLRPLDDCQLTTDLLLSAWEDRDPRNGGPLAVRIRESPCWPATQPANATAPWPAIERIAREASARVLPPRPGSLPAGGPYPAGNSVPDALRLAGRPRR